MMKTNMELVRANILKAESSENPSLKMHAKSMSRLYARTPFEEAIGEMVRGLALYADAHQQMYQSQVGEDCVLGPEWTQILDGIRGLLNGESGNLDCGSLDSLLCALKRFN